MLTDSTMLLVTEDIASTGVEDEIVLLNVATGRYYGLQGVGGVIWGFVQDGATLGHVCDRIVDEYDVARETAWEDIVAICEHMLEAGLVTVAQESKATDAGDASRSEK
jgi:hypothetical protein